ncbi:hypothetical protein BHE75_01260 [Sphingomonas haloaromaticamans]|uniref:Uncharacterized protein n=1 Tax=Edaphosphingomonas haloaromaticamans TaxID=653954 RepID=A0A1S1HB06_9SPHN|nr:hypothetical protein BHE75_01260 [Sphingomonas haloaromaticamans]
MVTVIGPVESIRLSLSAPRPTLEAPVAVTVLLPSKWIAPVPDASAPWPALVTSVKAALIVPLSVCSPRLLVLRTFIVV